MTQCAPQRIEWHKGPMLGFDLETTGIDVEHDRIVTAALVHIRPNRDSHTASWLLHPGTRIPDEASAIHGITTAHAWANGDRAEHILPNIVEPLRNATDTGIPIVGMNIVYDLTLLDRECRRHQHHQALPDNIQPVIDIRILDKHLDPYRRGKRTLTDLANHYRVQLDDAHNSSADALAALRIAYAIAQRYPQLQIGLHELHRKQIDWAAQQTRDFAAYRQRQGNPLDDTDGTWPIRPVKTMTVNA